MAGQGRASTLAFVLLLVCQAAGEKPELKWPSTHSPSTHSPKLGPSSPHHGVPEASATSAPPEAVSFLGRVTSFVTRRMKNPYVMAALYTLVTKDLSFVIAIAIWRLGIIWGSWSWSMRYGDIYGDIPARSENQHRMYMQKIEEEEERSREKHEAQMQRLEEEREDQHRKHMQNLEEEAVRSRQKHEAQMQRLEEERKAEMDRPDAHNVEPGRAQGSALNEAREQAAQKRHDQAMTSAIGLFKGRARAPYQTSAIEAIGRSALLARWPRRPSPMWHTPGC